MISVSCFVRLQASWPALAWHAAIYVLSSAKKQARRLSLAARAKITIITQTFADSRNFSLLLAVKNAPARQCFTQQAPRHAIAKRHPAKPPRHGKHAMPIPYVFYAGCVRVRRPLRTNTQRSPEKRMHMQLAYQYVCPPTLVRKAFCNPTA